MDESIEKKLYETEYLKSKPIRITSVDEFVVWVDALTKRWTCHPIDPKGDGKPDPAVTPWFRGMVRQSFHLTPSLVYMNDDKQWNFDEFWSTIHFRNKAHRLTDYAPGKDAKDEWLFLMRHHGAPSRLMDWTEGALTALFFSVENSETYDGVVYALNPFLWNMAITGKYAVPEAYNPIVLKEYIELAFTQTKTKKTIHSKHFQGRYAMAIRPTIIHQRMVAQRSMFTIHGEELTFHDEKHDKDLKVCLTEQASIIKKNLDIPHQDNLIDRVVIDAGSKIKIQRQLLQLGISRYNLYPDLDGLASELSFRFDRSKME